MEHTEQFWNKDTVGNERLGSEFPPVTLNLSVIDIAKINSKEPVVKTVVLSNGKEVDIEIVLDINRDVFTKELKELIDADSSHSS